MANKNANKKLCFISEEPTLSKIEIIEESAVPMPALAGNPEIPFGNQLYRIKFKARLQTANQANNNKRIYPEDTLREVYNQLLPKVKEGKLLGELDHPQVMSSDKNGQMKRSSTILLQNSCVHFLDMTFDGINIDAICQTTTNRAGLDFYALIKDGVTVGFSLRAFGEVEQDGDYIKVLPKGLKALTYDAVCGPSHNSAIILDILNENTTYNDLIKELTDYKNTLINMAKEEKISKTGIIEEAGTFDLNNPADQTKMVKVCANGFCSLQPIEESIEYFTKQALQNKKLRKIKLNF